MRRIVVMSALLVLAGTGCDAGPEMPYSCSNAADDDLDKIENALRVAGVESDQLATVGDCNSWDGRRVSGGVADKGSAERIVREAASCGRKRVIDPPMPEDVLEEDRAELADLFDPYWRLRCRFGSVRTIVEIFEDPDTDSDTGKVVLSVEPVNAGQ